MPPKQAESKAAAAARAVSASGHSRESLGKGARVWYRHDQQTWVPAEVLKAPASLTEAGPFSIQLLDSGKVVDNLDVQAIVPANPQLQLGIPDLTHLSYLNEPGILHNLQVGACMHAYHGRLHEVHGVRLRPSVCMEQGRGRVGDACRQSCWRGWMPKDAFAI